jgi:hypothetical protein
VDGYDDGNSYREMHAGRLRAPVFFEECRTNDDTFQCYAEPGSVEVTDCR